MRRILLIPIVICLATGSALGQCGPSGCPLPRPRTPAPAAPKPAWRYERPTGHRAAVVRITCHDGGAAWSKGSGVLVRWGARIVVLTARHVVKDAKTIHVEFHDRRRCTAAILKTDARWDCAVLDLGVQPEGIAPAEMTFGADAAFQPGDRLETCGYGPDGRLACNSGLFGGYRRSAAAPDGPDDWMILSGHARQGDSGGPVFDLQGRVAGILWGTDGREVVCVQPGRIHALLDAAVGEPRTAAGEAKLGRQPLLPWRGEAEKRDADLNARIERLIDLAERQQAAQNAPAVDVNASPPPTVQQPPRTAGRSPLLAGLCLLAGVAAGAFLYFGGNKI